MILQKFLNKIPIINVITFFKKVRNFMSTKRNPEVYEFELTETMWGYMSMGAASFKEGYEEAKRRNKKPETRRD